MSVAEQELTYQYIPGGVEFADAIPKACGVGARVIGTATNGWNDSRAIGIVTALDQYSSLSAGQTQYRTLSADQDTIDSMLEWWFPQGVEECRIGTLRQALAEILCSEPDYLPCTDFSFEPADMLVTRLVASLMANDRLGCARWVVENLNTLYPLSPAIQELRKLVQPGVPREGKSRIQNRNQDADWLYANRQAYLGKWVILREGQLVGEADSLASAVKNAQEVNLPQKLQIYHVI